MAVYYSLGLDIAGVTTDTSSLVISRKVISSREIECILLGKLPNDRECARRLRKNNKKYASVSSLKKILELATVDELAEEQTKFIQEQLTEVRKNHWPLLPSSIPLVVDTPLDTRELLPFLGFHRTSKIKAHIKGMNSYNELVKRSIDEYYEGRPPYADLIGSVPVRFKTILAYSRTPYVLAKNLFETYPRACIRELNTVIPTHPLHELGYGGSAHWTGLAWTSPNNNLLDNIRGIGIVGMPGVREILTDHELDAILCSVVNLSGNPPSFKPNPNHILFQKSQYLKRGVNLNRGLPKGYRVVAYLYWDIIKIVGRV
ncbi:hypothetical protein [Robertmurraya sp.]|uniref:hypothetical protein n=1 Tax=Robertmurraya sp. TaxID=2837525 RepID=UPI0037037ACA